MAGRRPRAAPAAVPTTRRTRSQAVSPGGLVSLETVNLPRASRARAPTAPQPAGVAKPPAAKKGKGKGGKRAATNNNSSTDDNEPEDDGEMELDADAAAAGTGDQTLATSRNTQSEHNISSELQQPMDGVLSGPVEDAATAAGEPQDPVNLTSPGLAPTPSQAIAARAAAFPDGPAPVSPTPPPRNFGPIRSRAVTPRPRTFTGAETPSRMPSHLSTPTRRLGTPFFGARSARRLSGIPYHPLNALSPRRDRTGLPGRLGGFPLPRQVLDPEYARELFLSRDSPSPPAVSQSASTEQPSHTSPSDQQDPAGQTETEAVSFDMPSTPRRSLSLGSFMPAQVQERDWALRDQLSPDHASATEDLSVSLSPSSRTEQVESTEQPSRSVPSSEDHVQQQSSSSSLSSSPHEQSSTELPSSTVAPSISAPQPVTSVPAPEPVISAPEPVASLPAAGPVISAPQPVASVEDPSPIIPPSDSTATPTRRVPMTSTRDHDFSAAFPDFEPLRVRRILQIAPEVHARHPYPRPEQLRQWEAAVRAWQDSYVEPEVRSPTPEFDNTTYRNMSRRWENDRRHWEQRAAMLRDDTHWQTVVTAPLFPTEMEVDPVSPPRPAEEPTGRTSAPSHSAPAVAEATEGGSHMSPPSSNSEGVSPAQESSHRTPQVSHLSPYVTAPQPNPSVVAPEPSVSHAPAETSNDSSSHAGNLPREVPSTVDSFAQAYENAQRAEGRSTILTKGSSLFPPRIRNTPASSLGPSFGPSGFTRPSSSIELLRYSSMGTQTSPSRAHSYDPHCTDCTAKLVCPKGHFQGPSQTQEGRSETLTGNPVAPRKRDRDQAKHDDDDEVVDSRPQKRQATGLFHDGDSRSHPLAAPPRQPTRVFRRNISYSEVRRRVAEENQGRIYTTMFRLPQLIAQNEADKRAAELQGPPAPGPLPKLPETTRPEPSTRVPLGPTASGSGERGVRDHVPKYLPRSTRAQPNSADRAVRVAEETRGQEGDGASRPRFVSTNAGARNAVTPSQGRILEQPQDLTAAVSSQIANASTRAVPESRENGNVNAVAGPSSVAHLGGDKTKSLRKRKRESPKAIPNPPGCSYGMDIDYFLYSSESEEEEGVESGEEPAGGPSRTQSILRGDDRTPKPAAKRVRFDKSPMDTPSKLRAVAPAPGPHGLSAVPVETEPQTPTPATVTEPESPPRPVITNTSGTYGFSYEDWSSDSESPSSSGSYSPPPPSAVAEGKQPATEVAQEPQPSLSVPSLQPSDRPTESLMPTASTSSAALDGPSTVLGTGLSGVPAGSPPMLVGSQTVGWAEEMQLDDNFSRDALWMYQQSPTGQLSSLSWPVADRTADTVGPDTVFDRLVGGKWNEQHAQEGFDQFCCGLDQIEDVEED